MRRRLQALFRFMVALGLPVASAMAGAGPPSPRLQVFRPGPGQPRVREAGARRYAPNALEQRRQGRPQPYKVPKPGEGPAKG